MKNMLLYTELEHFSSSNPCSAAPLNEHWTNRSAYRNSTHTYTVLSTATGPTVLVVSTLAAPQSGSRAQHRPSGSSAAGVKKKKKISQPQMVMQDTTCKGGEFDPGGECFSRSDWTQSSPL